MSWWKVFFVVFVAIPLLVLWGAVLVDIFRRTDLSGIKIATWVVLLLILPFIGAIAYFVTRPEAPVLRGGYKPDPEELERYQATQRSLAHNTPGGAGPRADIPPRAR